MEYVVNLLSKKPPDEKYAEEINSKKAVHFKRMEEVIGDDLEELPFRNIRDPNQEARQQIWFNNHSGQSLKMALSNLFQIILKKEKIP